MKRRDFIFGTAAAATGAAIIPNLWGCQKDEECPTPNTQPYFNYLEVSGISFQDIFISNIFMEVLYLHLKLTGNKKFSIPPSYGCSSTAYSKIIT